MNTPSYTIQEHEKLPVNVNTADTERLFAVLKEMVSFYTGFLEGMAIDMDTSATSPKRARSRW